MSLKETQEALDGAFDLTNILLKHFVDGVQLGKDVAGIVSDLLLEENKALLTKAVEGIKLVPQELKDASMADYVGLIAATIPHISKTLDVIKASKAAAAVEGTPV